MILLLKPSVVPFVILYLKAFSISFDQWRYVFAYASNSFNPDDSAIFIQSQKFFVAENIWCPDRGHKTFPSTSVPISDCHYTLASDHTPFCFLKTFADIFHGPSDLPDEMILINVDFSIREKVWTRST